MGMWVFGSEMARLKSKSCASTWCGLHIAGGKFGGHSSLHEATLKTSMSKSLLGLSIIV